MYFCHEVSKVTQKNVSHLGLYGVFLCLSHGHKGEMFLSTV